MIMRILFLVFSLLAAPLRAESISVFAAASLKTALDETAPKFETETGHTLTISFAGSSALARQIEQGAPADIFISANPDWMDHLAAQDMIAGETRGDLLANRLVLIAHGTDVAPVKLGPDLDLAELLGDSYLSMALVNAVPVGIYGKAALEHFGLWEQIREQVAQTDNTRAALALVSLGEAEFGIVYTTDAMADPNVKVVATFPEESHPPIRYPVAAVAGRANATTLQLLAFFRSPEAGKIFKRHGFSLIGKDG